MASVSGRERGRDLFRTRGLRPLEQRLSLQLPTRVLILPALPSQSVFAGVGILAGFLAVALETDGRDRWLRATALFGIAGLAALVGARLLWAVGAPTGPLRSATGWSTLVNPDVPGFWSIGAFVGGGLAALFLARRIDGESPGTLLDHVVPAGIVTLAFARLGCLSAGCDFGSPTELRWGLQYAVGTPAWETHLSRGLIDPEASLSAPTHPFPLYMVAVSVVALAIGTVATSRRVGSHSSRFGGARAIVVLLCYFSGRFVVEFFRDASSTLELAGTLVPISQWFSAMSIVVVIAIWWSRVGSE